MSFSPHDFTKNEFSFTNQNESMFVPAFVVIKYFGEKNLIGREIRRSRPIARRIKKKSVHMTRMVHVHYKIRVAV